MTIFYSDVEPFSKYFPVMLHLSPGTRILNETCVINVSADEHELKFKEKCCKLIYSSIYYDSILKDTVKIIERKIF